MLEFLFRKKVRRDEFDRKKHEADHGQKLLVLRDSPQWSDLLLVKESVQENAVRVALRVGSDDKTRFQAAVQYATIEAFFQEVSRRIQAGQEAQNQLMEMVNPK